MKRSRSREIALAAIACAVAAVALTLGSYVDFLLAAGYMIAVFAFMIPLTKRMVRGYLLAYAGAVVLSFLFTGFAVGLMQLMPETAEYVRAMHGYAKGELTDPAYNILLGSAYLSYLLGKYRDIDTALAAYNAGEGRVSLWLRDEAYSQDGKTILSTPFPETNGYLKKVKKNFKIYRILYR